MAVGSVGGGPVSLTEEEEVAYGMLEDTILKDVLREVNKNKEIKVFEDE